MSLSVEVVARALAERDAPRRLVVAPRPGAATSEDRRIHRNTLLENAEAGRYGAEIGQAARRGVALRELVDDLEQREAAGELQLRLPGIARVQRDRVWREFGSELLLCAPANSCSHARPTYAKRIS